MNKCLRDYAYRIDLSGLIFVIVGMTTLMIAFTAISFQAIKAATANPVKSLRSE